MSLKRPKPAWPVCIMRKTLIFVRLGGAAAWAPGGHKEHREVMGCPPHPMSCDGNPPSPVPGTALCHQHHTGKELQTGSQVVLGVS